MTSGGFSAWDPPGRGRWTLELSHFGGRMTPFYGDLYEPASREGTGSAARRYGVPFSHLQIAFVNHRPYVRPVPLIEPPGSGAAPPRPVLWLLARLHPEIRRRTRAAREAFERGLWREDGRRWYEEQKPAIVAANLTLQDEPVETLDDDRLADHIGRTAANFSDGVRVHFELIGPAIVIGDLIATGAEWGMSAEDVVALLAGSSPASAETRTWLEPVASAVRASGSRPRSFGELHAIGPEAAEALDRYVRYFGHRTVAGFDLDAPTLLEMPNLVVESVVRLAEETSAVHAASELSDAIPSSQRSRFEELLTEARYVYGIRDDNSGPALHWTAGLLRRALLESASRLVRAGRLDEPTHVFELTAREAGSLVAGGASPSASEVSDRAALRKENEALDAPATIGGEPPPPSLDALPGPLARVARAGLAALPLVDSPPDRRPLEGVGIGSAVCRGRARVARSPEEALSRLAPGDILVAPYTTPAYNAVLPIVSGLIVEEGGALSHAAIVAREFGIPAVIGALGAVTGIPDGAEVEVDAGAGRVRVLRGPGV